MAICWLRWRILRTCTHVEDMEILQMKHRFRNESALSVSHWCSQQNSDGVPKQHLQEVEAPSSLAVLKAGYLLYSKTIYIVILQGHISTNSPIHAAPFSSAVRYLCLYLEFFGVVCYSGFCWYQFSLTLLQLCCLALFQHYMFRQQPFSASSSMLPSHFHTSNKEHLRLKMNQSLFQRRPTLI